MDFSKQLQKADEALRRRNYDFAVELYQQLLELSPDLGEARAGLRQALKRRHEHKGGGGRFLRALSGAGPLVMARTLAKAGRHEAAAKQLESYLATNPLDEEGNLLLGMALESAGHTSSARAVYEFLAEIAPKSAEGLRRAGNLTRKLGDAAKALQYYERALAADPRDQEALRARKDLSAEVALSGGGVVQHSREQIKDKDAARELEQSQRMHWTEDELRAELGKLEARYADAPDPDLMLRLSEVHEKLKDHESALVWAERALAQRRDSPDLSARVGELRTKQVKKAIADAGKRGDQAEADRLEARLYGLEVEDARRRLQLRPSDPTLRLLLGRRLVRAGEVDGAMAELQKAAQDARCRRDAQALLAECFRLKGFPDLARREYERALEGVDALDERAKEILYHLGALAEEEGKPGEARAHYARIFEVDVAFRDVAARMERLR